MLSRLDELLIAYFHDDLSPEEEAELSVFVDSNAAAREKYQAVTEDRELARKEMSVPLPHIKTRLRTRIMAAILLAIILFGFIGMFWIKIEEPLVAIVDGKAMVKNEPLNVLREAATVKIDGPATIKVRGGTELTSESAEIGVDHLGPLASLTLISGSIQLARKAESRDSIYLAKGIEVRFLDGVAAARLAINGESFELSKITGHLALANLNDGTRQMNAEGIALTFAPQSSIELTSLEEGRFALVVKSGELSVTSNGAATTYRASDPEAAAGIEISLAPVS